MNLAPMIQEFPSELRMPMLRFAEAVEQNLHAQFGVRREDFDALRSDVQEVAAGQKRLEVKVDRLENALVELAAAQLRTELRVDALAAAQERTEQRLEQLAAAQERTEQRLEQLAAAQERTEQRLDALAAAQERTESQLEQLAAAQRRTEYEIRSLVVTVEKIAEEAQETRKQLGGLTMTVGYRLEDLAYQGLPALLERDFGVHIQGRLTRGYMADATGKALEVNIVGTAQRNGDQLTILGEGKAQLSKNDVDRFVRRRLVPLRERFAEVLPILVTYMISEPDVEEYAKKQGIALYYSYDFR
ncbi:MAG: hypothetical protein DWI57_17005 [Chloroflexi bacterium]|nr:MAG: hypothetical protein DWI57_17005 [Chloroflexota bacterium]